MTLNLPKVRFPFRFFPRYVVSSEGRVVTSGPVYGPSHPNACGLAAVSFGGCCRFFWEVVIVNPHYWVLISGLAQRLSCHISRMMLHCGEEHRLMASDRAQARSSSLQTTSRGVSFYVKYYLLRREGLPVSPAWVFLSPSSPCLLKYVYFNALSYAVKKLCAFLAGPHFLSRL